MINILTGLDSTSSALNAERIRMDVVSQNIANVNTTRGLNGKPYQRQQVVFEAVLKDQLKATGSPGTAATRPITPSMGARTSQRRGLGVGSRGVALRVGRSTRRRGGTLRSGTSRSCSCCERAAW